MWEFASDPGPDLMDMEEETRSHHDPQNRYRDRHRQRDERYGRRDDDHYRRNPGYNFGLEGKAKSGSRSAFVLRLLYGTVTTVLWCVDTARHRDR